MPHSARLRRAAALIEMALFVRIPAPPGATEPHPEFPVGAERYINVVNGDGSAVQRRLFASGFAGLHRGLAAALCAACEGARAQAVSPTFVDVGAGDGGYALLCAATLRGAVTVVAFEPDAQACGWLRAIDRANHLGVVTERLEVADTDAESSRAPRGTLDRYLEGASLAPTAIRFAAGVDLGRALRGARRAIASASAVLIETPAAGGGAGEELPGGRVYWLGETGEIEERAELDWQRQGAWLLAREPLTEEQLGRVRAWTQALAECTPDKSLPRKDALGRKGEGRAAKQPVGTSRPAADSPRQAAAPAAAPKPAVAAPKPAVAKPKPKPTPAVAKPKPGPPARAPGRPRLARKLRKLLRNPRGFFADARWPGAGVFRWLLSGSRGGRDRS